MARMNAPTVAMRFQKPMLKKPSPARSSVHTVHPARLTLQAE